MVPTEGGPKVFSVNPLAPKAPKQNFGRQPQPLEGEEGGYCRGRGGVSEMGRPDSNSLPNSLQAQI